MQQRFKQFGMTSLLGISLLAGLAGNATAADDPLLVAEGFGARTDGTVAVWQSKDVATIHGAYLSDGDPFIIAGGAGSRLTPDVHGGIVVWAEAEIADGEYDVLGKNLDTGEAFTVADSDASEMSPAISDTGHQVAWVSTIQANGTTVQRLMVRDIATMSEPDIIAEVQPGSSGNGILRPAFDGDRLVWAQLQPVSTHSSHWELRTQRLFEDGSTLIDEGSVELSGPNAALGWLKMPAYDIEDDLIVYTADFSLRAVNIVTNEERTITSIDGGDWSPAAFPTTDGRYIFWQDFRFAGDQTRIAREVGAGTLRSDIFGYDLATNSEFPVTWEPAYNSGVNTDNGGLVWTEQPGSMGVDGANVHVTTISAVVPTRPVPQGEIGANRAYFPETGHHLVYGFKAYWEKNGGLPVFGYPLTDEFRENGQTVQYMERQRFEYHPELTGTPYEVLLGRLGAEEAQRRNITGDPAFRPLPASSTGDANCEFFAETGHRLCFGFKDYWHSHGLDFGDPGMSYRESLALFGFPISEEFTDPQTGLTVQYFERARFEYHPDNPEPYKILLGRLSPDVLSERGW